MSIQDQLSKIKLKKAQVKEKTQIKEDPLIKQLQDLSLDFDLERWYDRLKDITFPTTFLPLSVNDVKQFVDAFKLQLDPKFREDFEARLNQLIDEQKGDQGGVFIKTSCRSAKDTTLFQSNFKKYYSRYLHSREITPNNKIIALLEAGRDSLKSYSAANMIELFLQSDRVNQDFRLALERQDRFNQNLIIRKWINIDVDMEFRAYIKNNKLCALSQYNYVCFFPRLVELKTNLQQRIYDFWQNQCDPLLRDLYSDYIIDFAITGENLDKLWVIELNEYYKTTDGCLFNWERDSDTLSNEPLEFRIVEEEHPDPSVFLSLEWKVIYNDESEVVEE